MNSNLKKYRTDANLSQNGLADLCGVTTACISLLEHTNPRCPKLITAYAISKVLDKTVYEIWPDTVEIVEETIITRRVKS